MGFMATIKAQQAMRAHGKGDLEQAKKLYEEAIDKGLMSARPMLGYAILLIREGSYDKAMPLLIKAQKCPDLTPDQKSQLFVDYAACLMKKGELDKAIHLLEKQHNRAPIGLTYQTLGYMYVEKYSGAKPVAEAVPEKAAEAPETEASAEEAAEQPKVKTQEDIDREWQEGIDKMFAFIQESVDYDDEDPVCLDNLGQAYYRVTGEKDKAKEWFEKAHAEKDSQIDTLWFLSRYDLEAGDKAAAIAKLEKALDVFSIDPAGLDCIDCGASTGGFTDCLLQRGARHVWAVDVGYGQLAWPLRQDARVTVMERTNARSLTPEMFPTEMALAVMDMSFISLKLVLPAVRSLLCAQGQAVCLVKPQFEAGRDKVGKKGVVRDRGVHREVLENFLRDAADCGFAVLGMDFSPVRGPEGNIEYLAHLAKSGESAAIDCAALAERSHEVLG